MPTNLEKARELFLHAVGKLPPEQWNDYLAAACGGDSELEQQVRGYLEVHRDAGSFLESPAPGLVKVDKPVTEGPGMVIGPYKLLEQIGEGGFGVVFMAEQTQPVRRKVALKVLKPGMDTSQVVARFEAERQALAIMDHPNIARIYDGGVTPSGRPYFVMELVKGVPITDFCDQNHLTPRERLELFVSACIAVQHAHQKGIIHRDLKPSNVLVTADEGTPLVKIIDFGVAKALGQELTDKTLFTGFAQMIGTPLYMSPEQAGQSPDIDTRSDIYSLGVLLYELLTGSTPFPKKRFKEAAYDEIRRIIREEEPPKPSTRLSESKDSLASISVSRHTEPAKLTKLVRGELDWIVMKALEKNRNRRYETASAFAADVQRYMGDEPVLACPPSMRYRLRKFARKNRNLLMTGAAFTVLLVLATTVSSWQWWRAQQHAAAEQAERERAEKKSIEAAESARQGRQRAYDASMLLAQIAWEEHQTARFLELLKDQEPSPGQEDLRGFEWYYWSNKLQKHHRTLKGHTGWVQDVAYSPDGRLLASGSRAGTVKVWDAQTGQEIRALTAHTDAVYRVAYSSDGRRLASASADQTVKVWDMETGRLALTLKGHTDQVHGVAFSPDRRRLASASADSTVRVWDAQSGQEIRTLRGHTGCVIGVVFSPDGRRIASASWDWTVRVWDALTGSNALTFTKHTDRVEGLTYSPDGRRIASGSRDGMVKVWEAQTGREVLSFRGHDKEIYGIAYSPDGSRLASSSGDGIVKVWEARTGQEILRFLGHTGEVYGLAYSPNGRRLASGSEDNTVKVWDVQTGQGALTLKGHTNAVVAVAYSPDGHRLASTSEDKTLKVWETQTGQEALTLKGHTNVVVAVAYSPDGRRLASASWDGTVKIWDAQTGQNVLTFAGHTNGVEGVAYSPDGRRLASASWDGTVRIWDAANGQEQHTFKGHTAGVNGVAFSPDGNHLGSASEDGTVRTWDTYGGHERRAFQGHTGRVYGVAFNKDGNYLASASEDGTVSIWDARTGQKTYSLRGHTAKVNSLAFSPDGQRLASASLDKTVKLWDPATGQVVLSLRGHADEVLGVAFSPDGARLASASRDGTVKVWDGRPWTPEVAVEHEALGLLSFLLSKPLAKADVLAYMRDAAAIRPEVRQLALTLAERYREEPDPDRYHRASRALVRQRYLDAGQYQFALWQAKTACRLTPDNGELLTTLGAAYYRVGNYPEALQTLLRSDQLQTARNQGSLPADLVFLAMTRHRLGQTNEARATLARLQEVMKQSRWANDPEAQDSLHEAEEFLKPVSSGE
jgi:WD40 repeat protein/serine/threonine protein kinase